MEGAADGVTRWRRVADGIRAAIGDGSLAGRLPAEAELAARFGVNRHTVRRAIAALAADGLLRAERGRGTFVSGAPPRLAYEVGPRTRFGDNVLSQMRRPLGRLLASAAEAADARLADLLDMAPGEALLRLETLHEADGLPVSVATHWFPAARFPRVAEDVADTGSITEALRRASVADYRRRETRLTAERASRADAAHLGAAPDAIVLVARAVDVDMTGRPVQTARTRFHAERLELVVRH